MEKIPPIRVEYSVRDEDDCAVFPFIDRTGERLVLVPKDKFEVVADSGNSIILREVKLPF
jgi:hypothetical protein